MATRDSLSGPDPSVRDRLRFARQSVGERMPTPGEGIVGYVFLLPAFLLFGVFLAFPIVYTFYLSFFRFEGVGDETLLWIDTGFFSYRLTSIADLSFVGLDNYVRMFTDTLFHQAMFNTTFILVVQVPLMVALALLFAVALDASFVKLRGVFRTVLALPVSANLVAYSTVFLLMMQDAGLINYVLTSLGLPAIPWLTSSFWSRMTIVGAVTWRWTGYNMIILLAGLQNIPQQLYEAAEIDGAVAANTNAAGPDVLYYGEHFYAAAEPSTAPNESFSEPGHWTWRLPLPWYFEAMGAETASTTREGTLNGTIAPVVVTRAENYDVVAPKLEGYEATTYRLTATDTPTVFFVRNDTVGGSRRVAAATVRPPSDEVVPASATTASR